jgi:hypothetical protein
MTTETPIPETPETPTWYLDEGRPGISERPEWLNEKFKTAADLAKSYNDLEKKFGTIPDDYDFSASRYLDPDYVPFQELRDIAKAKRVPQEVMDKMIQSIDKYMDEFNTDYSEEVKKLGEGAHDRLVKLDNWAKANLSDESYEALTANLRNAESIKALEELRGKMMSNNTVIPTGNDNANHGAATVADLKVELENNMQKYSTDAAYRKDWQARLEVAAKNNPDYIDKIGA